MTVPNQTETSSPRTTSPMTVAFSATKTRAPRRGCAFWKGGSGISGGGFSSLGERIEHRDGKTAEIAIAGDQLTDSMLDAQRRDVRVVEQISGDAGALSPFAVRGRV